jgi:hypothetical protein
MHEFILPAGACLLPRMHEFILPAGARVLTRILLLGASCQEPAANKRKKHFWLRMKNGIIED